MNTTVITASEADSFLALYEDWENLDDSIKEDHIKKACVYVQTYWTCTEDVVWEDDPDTVEVESVSVPLIIQEAIALYAYADFKGALFGDPTDEEIYFGNVRSIKDKAGSLATETTYFRGGSKTPSGVAKRLGYPDSLMKTYCTFHSASVSLSRV